MNNPLVILPLLIPLGIGISGLIRDRAQRQVVAIVGFGVNLAACLWLLYRVGEAGIQRSIMGAYDAPYGIAIVIDPLSAIMITITAIIAFTGAIYSAASIDANRQRFAFFPLLAFLIMGINLAFITGDLFTLYVSFEVMLMASFVLLTLGGERGQIAGGLKYVTLNLISSMIFLTTIGLTYAVVGTLNLAHLAERIAAANSSTPGITTVIAALFLIAFGIKAAVFPLFFWLPASYHTPPVAVTAILGALLTKVGVYSMWRVVALCFPRDLVYLQPALQVVAALTMITGVLGAIAQTDVRRLLSFHIISQIGYLLMGIALFTPTALSGAIFFMVHVILAKTALFFIAGAVYQQRGTYNLTKLGNVAKSHPYTALVFLIAAFSLAGIPPLAGFWAKMAILRAGLEAGQYGLVAVDFVVSLLTFYSMIKIWDECYWKPLPENAPIPRGSAPWTRRVTMGVATTLVVLMIVVGLFADSLFAASDSAAAVVINHQTYIRAVMPEVIP